MNTSVKYLVGGEEFYLLSYKNIRKLFDEGKITIYSMRLDEVSEVISSDELDEHINNNGVLGVSVEEYTSMYCKQNFSVKYARKLMDELGKEFNYASEEMCDLTQYIEGMSVHEDNDMYTKEGNEDVEDKHEVYFLKETLRCLKDINKLLAKLPYKKPEL